MENIYMNVNPNLNESILIQKTNPLSSNDQTQMTIVDQTKVSFDTNSITTLDDLLKEIIDIIKRLFEIKQSEKCFFLNNEQNLQLDSLLKQDLCPAIQHILEHGQKHPKKTTLWKIIEKSLSETVMSSSDSRYIPLVYREAKTIAQTTSSHWLYRFQAFIFILLNKNELINWLYYFTRQKDIIQRYYRSPDALVLASKPLTFNLFDRIMTQLEKLTLLAFQLTYHISNPSLTDNDRMSASFIDLQAARTGARDWLMTISRRSSNSYTQPTTHNHSRETLRSSISKKLHTLFTRSNKQQDRERKLSTMERSQSNRSDTELCTNSNEPIEQNASSSPSMNAMTSRFQSKMPRPSLNINTPTTIPNLARLASP